MAELRESTTLTERRRAREFALQLLFQLDLAPGPAGEAVEAFWAGKRVKDSVVVYANRLILGTCGRREWLDGVLAKVSHHWRIPRMAVVDRNILRLALFEMVFEPATPPIVVINEAIEIAKKFGNEESGPFINGILDGIRLRIEKGEIAAPDAGDAPRPEEPATRRA